MTTTPANRFAWHAWAAAIALAIAVAAALSPAWAGAQARVGQDRVVLGDPVTLELRLDGDTANARPDLSPLEADFDILGTSQSSQTSIVNGAVSSSRSWIVRLAPRKTGKLTIPAIEVGGERTRPLTVEVLDPASVPRGDLASVGIQLDVVVPEGPHYVQQEIPVTVRIMDALGLRQGRLTPLQLEGAAVRQAGEDRVTQQTWQGRPVRVLERTYLVTPERDGTLTIPPLTLRGSVPDPNARRSGPFGRDPFADMRQRFGFPDLGNFGGFGGSIFDDFMAPMREVTARSLPVALEVAPRPAGVDGWFLPARDVQLRASWETDPPRFAVGEATTRTVQILAVGAAQNQVPELEFADVPGARIYVDRSDVRETPTPDGSATIRQYRISVVPTQAGKVTLPEVTLEWFDVESGERKTARLAAETIDVAPGTGASAGATAGAGAATAPAPTAATPAAAEGDGPGAQDAPRGWTDRLRAALAALPAWALWSALALALALLGLWLVLARRRGAPKADTAASAASAATQRPQAGAAGTAAAASAATGPDRQAILRELRTACQRGDAARAYDRLLAWRNSGGRALERKDADAAAKLAEAVSALEAAVFGKGEAANWSGDALWAALSRLERSPAGRGKGRAARTGALPPLYDSDEGATAA